MSAQTTRHILLIEPTGFYANPETMDSNVYQQDEHESHDQTTQRAVAEFRAFRDMLVENGVMVTTLKGYGDRPDQVFPNWLSTHPAPDETTKPGMILYPMAHPSRQAEREPEIIDVLCQSYRIIHDLTSWEKDGRFLESTGSLALDRANRIAYAALSSRTTDSAVRDWCELMGFEAVTFDTHSHAKGKPVYHTDLVIFIGNSFSAACFDVIDEKDRENVRASLSAHRKVIELTAEQQKHFTGNALEVKGHGDEPYLVMSTAAYQSLTEDQIKRFKTHVKDILHSPLPTLETYGGGSARCLMNEMF